MSLTSCRSELGQDMLSKYLALAGKPATRLTLKETITSVLYRCRAHHAHAAVMTVG